MKNQQTSFCELFFALTVLHASTSFASEQSCLGGTTTLSSVTMTIQAFTANNQCLEITSSGSIGQQNSPMTSYAVISTSKSGLAVTNAGGIYVGLGFNTWGILNSDGSTMNILNNLGVISAGNGEFGIYNLGSTITALNNSGTVSVAGVEGYGINNYSGSTITTLINAGIIFASGNRGVGIRNDSGSVITTILNTGTITASGLIGTGIYNFGSAISVLNNTGTISANEYGGYGIYNDINSTITTITNTGSIYGGMDGFGIVNDLTSTITSLNNAQGGNASSPATTALTYQGALPTNYNIIINSASYYGQLAVSSPIGTITNFGIYGTPLITSRTYAGVLSGTGGLPTGTRSGTYDNMAWSLVDNGSAIDLVFTGASLMGTQQSLVNTASVLQGTFTLQNSVMVNGFTYDCSLFDKRGICVSAGGRNTTVQAQGINNTSGLLIASYRLDKNNSRIGAWVDQNLSVSGPGTVQLGNSTPMIGLFGVWSQRPDGVGAEVKVSAAYGQKDTTITRQIVGLSEAGSGGSQLISQGAQVVAKYGFAVMPDVVVSPYAGVRYTQNNMGGYTEATSSAVTAPLTYSALNTNATTALAGVGASYRGIPKTTLFAIAGVETDTNTSNGSYLATGVDGLTPVNFNPNPVKTRPTATVGGYYDILKNQRIGVTGIYRQEPFQAVSTTTVLATYTIGL